MTPTAYVVSAGVADVRRYPDATSELVTQGLMNMPLIATATSGEWTYATFSDYEGWMHTDQLEEPIIIGYCTVGEACRTPLHLMAVIVATRTSLYTDPKCETTQGTVYLSTALPLLDITRQDRVQAALPAERTAWLKRSAISIHEEHTLYPRRPIHVITSYARALLDTPYLWGGTSQAGIDCSGFVQLCYRMSGYSIPRDAYQQHHTLEHTIERQEMQEGDLIFFGSQSITHVALALNNKEYIHSEGQHYNRVVINSFDPADAHYYQRLDEIVWAIKRVAV